MKIYITEESDKSESDIISTIVGILISKPNKKITITQRSENDKMLFYYDNGEVRFIEETLKVQIIGKSSVITNI